MVKKSLIRYGKRWSEEEDDFLIQYGGIRSLTNLARKLKRTPAGVEKRMDILGICCKHALSGTFTSRMLAQTLGVDSTLVIRWIKHRGLPANQGSHFLETQPEFKGKRYKRYFINTESFWEWAEQNRDCLNWSTVERNCLPPEPEWVEEQRKLDQDKAVKVRKNWTPEEDEKVWKYFYQDNLTQTEIAKKMSRTKSGIEKRLKRLREKRLVSV